MSSFTLVVYHNAKEEIMFYFIWSTCNSIHLLHKKEPTNRCSIFFRKGINFLSYFTRNGNKDTGAKCLFLPDVVVSNVTTNKPFWRNKLIPF